VAEAAEAFAYGPARGVSAPDGLIDSFSEVATE
jgi:hypothetical protein